MLTSESNLTCPYASTIMVVNRRSKGVWFTVGLSLAVCFGYFFGMMNWWAPLSFARDGGPGNNSAMVENSSTGGEGSEGGGRGLVLTESARLLRKESVMCRVLKLAMLVLAAAFLAVGPNAAFVLVVFNQNISITLKRFARVSIIVVKVLSLTLAVPRATREIVHIISSFSRRWDPFALFLIIAVTLSCICLVIIPCVVIFLTDPQCFQSYFLPLPTKTRLVNSKLNKQF